MFLLLKEKKKGKQLMAGISDFGFFCQKVAVL